MQFAPRTDFDPVPKSTMPVSSTGYTQSSRLTDVMEWGEEEEAAKDELGWDAAVAAEKRAGKRREQEPDVEIASHDSNLEMGPIRRGATRHFFENGSGIGPTYSGS